MKIEVMIEEIPMIITIEVKEVDINHMIEAIHMIEITMILVNIILWVQMKLEAIRME